MISRILLGATLAAGATIAFAGAAPAYVLNSGPLYGAHGSAPAAPARRQAPVAPRPAARARPTPARAAGPGREYTLYFCKKTRDAFFPMRNLYLAEYSSSHDIYELDGILQSMKLKPVKVGTWQPDQDRASLSWTVEDIPGQTNHGNSDAFTWHFSGVFSASQGRLTLSGLIPATDNPPYQSSFACERR